jgi:hypothetical protein
MSNGRSAQEKVFFEPLRPKSIVTGAETLHMARVCWSFEADACSIKDTGADGSPFGRTDTF